MCLEPDGSFSWLESLSERRHLFGRESVELYKIKAGIKVRGQTPDWKLTFAPYSVTYAGRLFDSLDISHRLELSQPGSAGVVRTTRMRNSGSVSMRVFFISVHDPTTAHFQSEPGSWGCASVNGFNRTSHVAMDEVADPPSARVIGSIPAPKSIYMTTDRSRADEILRSGEFPESTAGMSGQVLLLMLHDFDIPPNETREVSTASLYNPASLEDALSDFKRLPYANLTSRTHPPLMECSSDALTAAMHWVRPSLEGVEFEPCLLDRVECLAGLPYLDHATARRLIDEVRGVIDRKRGCLPHSDSKCVPGQLESAVFLSHAANFALLSDDRKYSKALYAPIKKLANFLCKEAGGDGPSSKEDLPIGWRRMIGKGFPTGMIAEVVLSTAGALTVAAALAGQLGKAEDSARYDECSRLLLDSLRRKLVDERGSIALNIDRSGIQHKDETIDQAVGLYRYPFDKVLSSRMIHRLQESDFETGFGPRTIPTSNRVYFNGSYGNGQLGGYWTRAALAHAVLSYTSGYAGLGSLELQRLGKLAMDDLAQLGAAPGSLPVWIDIERKVVHGRGGDPVAASRMVEAVVRGELGYTMLGHEVHVCPPASSTLGWAIFDEVWLGEGFSAFVGRSRGKVFTFARCSDVQVDGGSRYASFERLQATESGVAACLFHGPGQTICVGNNSKGSVRSTIRFGPKAPELLQHLSVRVEELDKTSGSWNLLQTLRVTQTMSLDVSLGAGEWKVFRLSTA